MAGHSKWANIKHKKAAADAKRGKVFTMHAKLIAIAAKSGDDPDMNPGLRAAIDRAKADNVPNANIDRAIKKGSGQDKDAANYEEITYEVIGAQGTAFMVDVITDNKNRSLTNVRTIVTKNGGQLGSAGSVAWKFDKMAYLQIDTKGADKDEAELTLIDCGADDLGKTEEGDFELFAAPDQLGNVRDKVEALGYAVKKDELIWKAKDEMTVDDVELAKKVLKLMDALDEDDDVTNVYSNVDLADSVVAELG